MDLLEHFRLILRQRWQVLVPSALIAAVIFGWSSSHEPVYRSVALISLTSGRAVSGQSVTEAEISFLTQSYAELAETAPVLVEASRRSGVPLEGPTGPASISAADDGSGFLSITADAPSLPMAAALAKGGADALIAAVVEQQRAALQEALDPVESEIRTLQEQLSQAPGDSSARAGLEARHAALLSASTERRLAPVDRLSLVSNLPARSQPVAPTPLRDGMLAFLVALILNAEFVVLWASLKDRFSTEQTDESIADLTGLRVLARVPEGGEPDHVEAFRTLRTNLMFIDTQESLRSVAVVSADPNAGKTSIAIGLAQATGSLDVPVVLIDGDLRRPSIHNRMGTDLAPGLSDLLSGSDIHGLLKAAPGLPELRLMTAGLPVHDPAAMLGSRFGEALSLVDWAGMVVVDTPPCALFSDGLVIASHCTASILVVDLRSTRRRTVRSLLQQLRDVGAHPIGVVINRSAPVATSYYDRTFGRTEK